MNVAEIRRQLRQQTLDIRALTIPRHQAMNRKGVAEVVEAWLITRSSIPTYADAIAQANECSFGYLMGYGLPAASHEEGRLRLRRVF